MSEVEQLGLVANLGQFLGVSEPALNLLLGILAGYPIALIYRSYIYNKDEKQQCMYFFTTGLAIGFWNYQYSILHCLLTIFIAYCAILLLKGTLMVAVVFVINFMYLLIGYYYSGTDSYDITWTMPYCILVLRLIGVAFDVYDGTRKPETLSSDSRKTALEKPPTLIQLLGHCMFPSAFLIGPQFSMRRFLDFVNGKFHSKGSHGEILPPDSVQAAVVRFSLGVFYLALFQFLALFVYDDLIISEEFGEMNFFKRMVLLGIWGRFTLYKYISCWLLAEGACILFGLSCNEEKDGTGISKWDGVANIKVAVFENSTEFNHYIMSFNANTNQWVAQHIYKRLKFLGNKYYSQGGVLLFLAVWHGFHSGYYVTFLHEFVVMYTERDFQSFIKRNESIGVFLSNPLTQVVVQVALRLYTFVLMGWSLLPFVYLQFPRYWKAFSNCGYVGFIVFYVWPIFGLVLRKVIKKKAAQS